VSIPVGPFELGELLGVGGMGEVWAGIHTGQNVHVAVKVITAARARDPRFRDAFQNEVRAVAGLDHPGIVHVFDYGEVDGRAETGSLGRLVAGSPFLAMEVAEGGSLRTRPTPHTWDELKGILMWLLDVLAHAHARNVIHRDIKPGNVLVFGPDNRQAVPSADQLRLTDFGLAHAADRGERAMRGTSGTPTYMAPEQFLGQWRDFGPWTDLYAVGCMAYSMSTGAAPFRSGGIAGLRQAHLASDPAPIRAVVPVPSGFESWVLRLMDKDTRMRFQCAADAAFALSQMGDKASAEPIAELPKGAVEIINTRFTFDDDWGDMNTTAMDTVAGGPPAKEETSHYGKRPTKHLYRRQLPPLPSTWRIQRTAPMSMRLVGAGLGLYGLRTIPLVGRHAERDAIWAALQRAKSERRTQLVALRGLAGTGKTRLAQWMSRRASELGNAVIVYAEHSEGGGAQDGLARLVSRALGAVGMTRPQMLKRAEHWLRRRGITDAREWNGLVELVWPTAEDPLDELSSFDIPMATPTERYALLVRLLRHLAAGLDERANGEPTLRPVIVLLDDLQWGAEAFGLARHLMGLHADDAPPMLVLATLRDDALMALPGTADEVASLLSHPRAQTLPVEPLNDADAEELVRELLGLEAGLAKQVEGRTAGNPLFAVQLVGDWVQRGVLEVSGSGFALRKGEQAILPDDIHSLWAARIQRVIDQFETDPRPALETASLLGNNVDDAEWRGACSVSRAVVPTGLMSTLIDRRLATPQSAGWAFSHGMLRESLVRQSEESGRAKALHDACATTLQIRFAVARQPGLAERLARHLVSAGRYNEALRPLQEGARERRLLSAYTDALELLDTYEDLLERIAVPEDDSRWGAAWTDRADLLISAGRLQEAEALALKTVDQGYEAGWDALVASALRLAATVSIKTGRLTQARARLQEAEQMARQCRSELILARCQLLLGDLSRVSGNPRDALHFARDAFRKFTALGDFKGRADALTAQASATRAVGDLDRTERYARQAIPLYEQVGSRFGVASCQNILGEVLRESGDLDGASDAYAQAESLLRRMGSREQIVPQVNGGLVALAREDYATANSAFTRALSAAIDTERRGLQGSLHAFLLPCVAHARDWQAWREHLNQARIILEETGIFDADIAWACELGAQQAGALGYASQAIGAYKIAFRHFQATQDRNGVARVRKAVEAIQNRRRSVD
jgi:serine/threonine protein kinase/tetratricopeptide (TPR) repeat protein